jgi:hypothetical protein
MSIFRCYKEHNVSETVSVSDTCSVGSVRKFYPQLQTEQSGRFSPSYLKTETDPDSETLYSCVFFRLPDDGWVQNSIDQIDEKFYALFMEPWGSWMLSLAWWIQLTPSYPFLLIPPTCLRSDIPISLFAPFQTKIFYAFWHVPMLIAPLTSFFFA